MTGRLFEQHRGPRDEPEADGALADAARSEDGAGSVAWLTAYALGLAAARTEEDEATSRLASAAGHEPLVLASARHRVADVPVGDGQLRARASELLAEAERQAEAAGAATAAGRGGAGAPPYVVGDRVTVSLPDGDRPATVSIVLRTTSLDHGHRWRIFCRDSDGQPVDRPLHCGDDGRGEHLRPAGRADPAV